MSEELWTRYLEATAERGARPLLERALGFSPPAGDALDLGCGAGGDTLELLRAGYSVLAVDALPRAVEHVRRRAVAAELTEGLEARVCEFEALELDVERFGVIVASFSLPFCTRSRFDALWARVATSLRPGGVFAGQFFGDRDDWASDPEHLADVFLRREEMESLLEGLETLHLEEEEKRQATALGDEKDWHIFHVVARRPAPPAAG